ncbi:MAG: Heavy metal translocating P-type ATPase [Candidatus Nomurabacteria bacterium GW2011_GWD1_44_10]|nr:MAG: Heavy metal translocating P-type ATPase [Candidatus Nomurabacteria bacterium GW2011_GWD1_44_10]
MNNNEHFNFKRALRFEISLVVLFLATFALYVGDVLPARFEGQILGIVGFVGIVPVARSAYRSLKEKKLNVDLLATIALFFSFISAEWSSMLFINIMLAGARVLDLYTKRRVRKSLESLIKLKPSKARVIRDGETTEIALNHVRKGDLVVVNLGEQIPVDGIVSEGGASVNQASLTGESVPVLREVGSTVLSATVVVSGNIVVKAERIGAETTFERMINLIEASHDAKTRMRTSAERFSSWYIGIMLLVAIVLYILTMDTRLVLAVVLVVCADDIAIAVPLAYIVAIGTAARRGIIIKSADFLELAGKINTLVVDKTGTLTLGKLAVENARAFEGATMEHVLELSGTICARSNHPVSKAIMEYAKNAGCSCAPPESFKEVEGRGIIGASDNDGKIIIGRAEFLNEEGIKFSDEVESVVAEWVSKGNNVTLISLGGKVIGMFALADEMREGVASAIQTLKQTGVKEVVMLTGDNDGVAKKIADYLGIDKYYSKLLPEHKVYVLRDYLGKHERVVAMVGDGVNDSAVLARADVGIAMGGIGSDAAIESADIVLMQDNFEKILDLRGISKKVSSIVQGNFVIWGVVNTIGLYLVFTHTIGPSGAAAYNFLTDFIPIANSLRLFRYK